MIKSDEIKKDLSLIFFVARKTLSYKHEELVSKTELTRPIISAIENGSGNPTIDSILKLKSVLLISNDFLLMNKSKFQTLRSKLKKNYSSYLMNNSKLHVTEKDWKMLFKLSDDYTKPTYSKIIKICRRIVEVNLNNEDEFIIQNAIIGASLGVIFQTDGFEDNMNFGFWLGSHFFE